MARGTPPGMLRLALPGWAGPTADDRTGGPGRFFRSLAAGWLRLPGLARAPLRTRVILVVALVHVGVTGAAAWLLIANAREAVLEETAANVALARNLSIALIAANIRHNNPAEALADLHHSLQQTRHVRITLLNNEGDVLAPPGRREGAERVPSVVTPPGWFVALIAPAVEVVRIPIALHTESYGAIVITTEPSDEIEEVWQDFRDLLFLMISVSLLLLLAVYALLGRTLGPISTILQGLEDLREARYSRRIPSVSEPDLDLIGSRLNALAARLETTTREKDRLGQQLVGLQDRERKAIALELHDEFGPCLFGIQVNARGIDETGRRMSGAHGESLSERARDIMQIADQMQTQSRALLRHLRPMDVGHVSLAQLLRDLVAWFRARYPDVALRIAVPDEPASFGEVIDLTLYRAVQEALTNAMRHADPKSVSVALTYSGAASSAAGGSSVELRIRDDGRGLPDEWSFGLGLTGMSHRVRVLGGSFEIGGGPKGGTVIRIRLPVPPTEATDFPGGGVAL